MAFGIMQMIVYVIYRNHKHLVLPEVDTKDRPDEIQLQNSHKELNTTTNNVQLTV